MNGDLNIWSRTFADPPPSSGGAQAVYGPNGDYLGFRSQDGIFWPQPGATRSTPQAPQAPAPAQSSNSDLPWSEPKFAPCRDPNMSDLQRGLCIIGIDPLAGVGATATNVVTDPVGSVAKGAGVLLDAPWMKALVVVAIGGLFLWTGLQGLIRGNG